MLVECEMSIVGHCPSPEMNRHPIPPPPNGARVNRDDFVMAAGPPVKRGFIDGKIKQQRNGGIRGGMHLRHLKSRASTSSLRRTCRCYSPRSHTSAGLCRRESRRAGLHVIVLLDLIMLALVGA